MQSIRITAGAFAVAAMIVLAGGAEAQERPGGVAAAFESGRIGADLAGLAGDARARALDAIVQFGIPAADARYLRADRTGALFYVDPVIPPSHPFRTGAAETRRAVVNVDPGRVFELHSKPGASRVVYLNFLGETLTDTAWNGLSGFGRLEMLPYSEDDNLAEISQAEANTIAEVWARIAEDYAPFDIDVTTERPAAFGPEVGHLLFTPRLDANDNPIYPSRVGGVAYVGVWGQSNFPFYQPALVFSEAVGGAKNLTEAASHELGHNLGLSHDGTASLDYYGGHGTGNVSWAPIMGVGYGAAVSQWSKGEYLGANNQQDDLAIIASGLTYRTDDHGRTKTDATALVVTKTGRVLSDTMQTDPFGRRPARNRGIIENRSDVDVFMFDVVQPGLIDLTITPSWRDAFVNDARGSNLDIRATLYRGTASANPAVLGRKVADVKPPRETDARIRMRLSKGRYYLAITGVGAGRVKATGYSAYGSLGHYTITGRIPRP